jgi:sec-independent protein translocase protein TatB
MGTPPPIQLANLGMADSLILMVMALVVFGPRRLPQIGRQIGKLMYEFRKASNDFKFQMEEELRVAEEADRRKKEEEQRRQLAVSQPAQESVSATPELAKSIASPYLGEDTYPEIKTAELPAPDDAAPRILPPSTGVTVAARRSEQAELTEPPADTPPEATSLSQNGEGYYFAEEKKERTPQEPSAVTEQATHNG